MLGTLVILSVNHQTLRCGSSHIVMFTFGEYTELARKEIEMIKEGKKCNQKTAMRRHERKRLGNKT